VKRCDKWKLHKQITSNTAEILSVTDNYHPRKEKRFATA